VQLRSKLGATAGGMLHKRRWLGWGLAGLLGVLAVNEAVDQWKTRTDPVAAAASVKAAIEEAAEDAAKDAAKEAEKEAKDAAAEASADAANAAAAPVAQSASAAAAAVAQAQAAKTRIAELESQLAEAKKPKPFRLREEMKRVFAGIGLQFGWGIVYFSLLPAWWGGQTVGKKLFRLRVVEITGKPMTVMRCLKRYGGYAAGMATGGLGFTQMLWDPNRQGIQDKAAHTVVLDLRPGTAAHGQVQPQPQPQPQPLPVETPASQPPPTA
jgi:RDD family